MKRLEITTPFCAVVPVSFGAIGIRSPDEAVLELVYLPPSFAEKSPTNWLAEQAAGQVKRYMSDPDFHFDLPLANRGTIFQRKIWAAIASIPLGEVRTYGQIAQEISSAPRAVGQACGNNPFPLVIPCHRVTAASGLGGFAHHDDAMGFHVGVKRWLLMHEKIEGY